MDEALHDADTQRAGRRAQRAPAASHLEVRLEARLVAQCGADTVARRALSEAPGQNDGRVDWIIDPAASDTVT